MQTSEIIIHKGGGATYVGPDATNLVRAVHLRGFITLYMRSGMIPTRGLTITKLLTMCKQYTNKTYKRTEQAKAVADMTIWIDTMKLGMPITEPKE